MSAGTVALLVAAVAPVVVKAEEDQSWKCRNPLFATHWAGKSDIRHLAAEPIRQGSLSLCPQYNGAIGCCTEAFEAEQKIAFDRWIEHFKRKVDHVRDFQTDMVGIQMNQDYVQASEPERALFRKALESIDYVLDTSGTCFDTLLEYLAGILCSACHGEWADKVILDKQGGMRIVCLRVDESSNQDLWYSCQELGRAGDRMHARIGDSYLAKSVRGRFEDLRNFTSRISLAEYMAASSIYAMHGPNEEVLKLDTRINFNAARRLSEEGHETGSCVILPDGNSDRLFPVRDGRTSGFECTIFPRKAVNRGAAPRNDGRPRLLSALACGLALLAAGAV